MKLEDLNGVYELSIKTNAGGAYSVKPITGDICIENGQIKGADELNVMWCGSVEAPQDGYLKYHITVDPKKASDIIIRKEDGMMTDEHRHFTGTFKIAEKEGGALMLSSFENMSPEDLGGEYKAMVSLKRVLTNTDCAICKE